MTNFVLPTVAVIVTFAGGGVASGPPESVPPSLLAGPSLHPAEMAKSPRIPSAQLKATFIFSFNCHADPGEVKREPPEAAQRGVADLKSSSIDVTFAVVESRSRPKMSSTVARYDR